jgi:glycosyltransferase involved in cell wall biosynthesis
MKVLNVNMALGAVSGGGTGERTLQMSRFLKRAGAECAILTLDIGRDARSPDALPGIPVTALRCVLPRFYIFALPEPRVTELVRWADVIHVMNHWTLLNAVVYRAARREGRPYVVCPAGALQVYGRSSLAKRLYNRVVGNRIIRDAAACVAIADHEIDLFRDYGVANDRIDLIPNGVDPDAFRAADPAAFRKKFSLGDAPFILFLGRLNPIKGPDLLLQAFSRIQDTFGDLHLVFAGPDEGMLGELQNMARQANLSSRVHFIGSVSGADKASAYSATQLLVIPSRREAMSIVVLEAGICGTPVLITDQCGFDEVARIGGGRVVGASPDALESGLTGMLKEPEPLRAMGLKLKDHVVRRFLWESTARAYLELFERILKAKREET